MRKPVSEHSTTIRTRKGDAPRHEHSIEPVGGGTVRRVEFEEDRRPVFKEEPTDASWRPRAHDSIDQIHFEIDNMHRLRRPAPRSRRPRDPPETRRVFETEGGAVKEARQSTTEGERRVLYTSRRQGAIERDQRFHSGLVDRVIAQRYHGGPQWTEATDEKPRGWLRRGKEPKQKETGQPQESPETPEEAPDEPTAMQESLPAEPERETAKPKAAGRKKAPRATDVAPPGRNGSDDYRPQCEAVTASGKQCRNSAKGGSDFCGSHQGHKARRLVDLLDTVPSRGDDTRPGVGDRAGTGQCAAYTKDGGQCRNTSRTNSKYCAVHRGYRPPSRAALAKRLDTRPRHAKAKDTKPRLR